MEIYNPFDLVVVPFSFTDRQSAKRRPALVISRADFLRDTGHVVLTMVTTAKQSAWDTDVPLKHWKKAGLPHASRVRAKLFTLDAQFILRRLNALTRHDRKAVRERMGSLLFPDLGEGNTIS